MCCDHSQWDFPHPHYRSTDKPLNCFQNQLILEEARFPLKHYFLFFKNKKRHTINFTDKESLLNNFADAIVPKGVNGLHCDLHTLATVQDDLGRRFPTTKLGHCKNCNTDIFGVEERTEVILGAGRLSAEIPDYKILALEKPCYRHFLGRGMEGCHISRIQLGPPVSPRKCETGSHRFPKMAKLANEMVQNSKPCSKAKYDRHPKKQGIGESPIPFHVGEMLHIDIFSTYKKHFLTCIDKFRNSPSYSMCRVEQLKIWNRPCYRSWISSQRTRWFTATTSHC